MESTISSLPSILKKEILYPKLNDKEFGLEERKKVTMRVVTMFQINFDSDEVRGLAMAEFGSFLKTYSLTGEEVLEAYRMVAKVELADHNGEVIKFYPNLSIGQAGKILKAYQDYKQDNALHSKGVEQLKSYLNPPAPPLTEAQKLEQRMKLLEEVKKMIAEHGICEFAFLVYDEFVSLPDFQDYRKSFVNNYDLEFKKWIGKQRVSDKAYHSKAELKQFEQDHQNLMKRLKSGDKVAKKDFCGAPYQNTKNKLIENYLKIKKHG